jgi:nucleoside-diphosphate-sugar epimerase
VPIVAITGASGFIGSELVRSFNDHGWAVVALVRNPATVVAPGVTAVAYRLDLQVRKDSLAGVDTLVHAALDKRDPQLNLDGTRRLITAAAAAGVRRRILLSSLSARAGTVSGYGRYKLDSERLLDAERDVAIRAGLVIGMGGLVGRTVTCMRRCHVLPLVDGGLQPVQIVGIRDLAETVVRLADPTSVMCGTFSIAEPRVRSVRSVYRTIARALGIRVIQVPVPSQLALVASRLADLFALPFPLTQDNLHGLRAARAVDTAADLRQLGITLRPLEELAYELR